MNTSCNPGSGLIRVASSLGMACVRRRIFQGWGEYFSVRSYVLEVMGVGISLSGAVFLGPGPGIGNVKLVSVRMAVLIVVMHTTKDRLRFCSDSITALRVLFFFLHVWVDSLLFARHAFMRYFFVRHAFMR